MAKIYEDFKSTTLMSFGKSFSRLNGQPLDDSSIYYSLAEAEAYAKTDAAYVGQPIAVIDKNNSTSKLYLIINANGDLQEVGAASADKDTTYTLEITRKEGTEQDPTSGIIISLTPSEGEGQSFLIPDTDLSNYYTKSETDIAIAAAVTAAAHLKRKVVADLTEAKKYIAENNDYEQYVYMVPTGLTEDDNKYYEYIAFKDNENNRVLEPVGSWEVKLDDYLTQKQADTLYSAKEEVNILSTTVGTLSANLNNKVDKEEGKTLILTTDVQKLENLLNIKEISDSFELDSDSGTLSLKAVNGSLITDLDKNETIINLQSQVSNLNIILNGTEEDSTSGLVSTVANLVTVVDNIDDIYLTQSIFYSKVGKLEELNNRENTIIEDIDILYNLLSWRDMDENATIQE